MASRQPAIRPAECPTRVNSIRLLPTLKRAVPRTAHGRSLPYAVGSTQSEYVALRTKFLAPRTKHSVLRRRTKSAVRQRRASSVAINVRSTRSLAFTSSYEARSTQRRTKSEVPSTEYLELSTKRRVVVLSTSRQLVVRRAWSVVDLLNSRPAELGHHLARSR